MNILFVTTEYEGYGIARGIGAYLKEISQELILKGNFVLIVTLTTNKNLIGEKKFSKNLIIIGVYVSPYFKFLIHLIYAIKLFFILPKIVKRYRIEIIESTDYAYPTVFYNLIKKVPVVIRLHTPGSYLLKFEKQNFKKKLLQIWLKFWEKINLKFSTCLSSPSLVLKEEIIKIFNPKKEIVIIPNGILIQEKANQFFLKKEQNSQIIFYLGGLSYPKGIDLLVKSCDLAFLKRPDINMKCLIAGPNNLDLSFDKFLENTVHKENIQKCIYLGPVNREEGIKLLRKATIFLFLSRWENFPMVILEAMKYKVPLIVLSNSGVKEILTEKEAIIISEENPQKISEEIIKLIENEKIRARLVKNAKIKLKEFDIKKIATKTLNFYLQVIQKYGKRRVI